jgi:hypothetical protein
MKQSGLEFHRMSDRECWDWLVGYLAELHRDPRASQLSWGQAQRRASIARDCCYELRQRGTQLTLLADAIERHGNVS